MKKYAVKRWLKKYVDPIVPLYTLIPAALCVSLNSLVYYGARVWNEKVPHHDLTTLLDRKIPFHPGWSTIYLLSFVFWIVGYVMVARRGKEQWYRFVVADLIAKTICGICFVLLPTTNVRPDITSHRTVDALMRFIYTMDSPTELFPSIHCLESWFVYIGVRGSKKGENIPEGFQHFALLFAVLVCASTQFTKQHYLIDIPAAILLAESAWLLAGHVNWAHKLQNKCEKLTNEMFGQGERQHGA